MRKTFTLIELLMVVAVIGILLSILLPALGQVKRHVRRIQCVSQLKHLQAGAFLYVDDFDGYLAGCRQYGKTAPWLKGPLLPYLSLKLLKCPEEPRFKTTLSGLSSHYAVLACAGYNVNPGPDYWPYKKIVQISHPSRAGYFLESISVFAECKWRRQYVVSVPDMNYIRGGQTHWRHNNYMGCSFLDGHVEMRTNLSDFGSTEEEQNYFGTWK